MTGWHWSKGARQELAFLAGLIALAILLGAAVGAVLAALLVALLVFIARQLNQLFRLLQWLRTGRQRTPPESWGLWGEVFDQYYRRQQRHRRRKQALSEVLREFRESTAAMPDGTLVLDKDLRIQWFNGAAKSMLQLTRARDLKQPIGNLIRDPAFNRYLQGTHHQEPVMLDSPRHPGQVLSARLIAYGRDQYLLIFRDITRLQRLEAMRRDFVANASHELRSPLTVLSGYLETLAEAPEIDPSWDQPIGEMLKQVQRMTSLVSDLLELSRLETEQQAPEQIQAVDVPALVRRVVDEAMRQDEAQHDIALTTCEAIGLKGSAVELHSAFSNLLINAMRYTPKGKAIRVSWSRRRQGDAVFTVADEGIGIEAQHLPFITQRFYRVDSARHGRIKGTGLGLAIVKHVLQRHEATLEVDSEPGQGSTFRCCFPASRQLAVDDSVDDTANRHANRHSQVLRS